MGHARSAGRWVRGVALIGSALILVSCGRSGIVPAPSAGPTARDKDAPAEDAAVTAEKAAEVIALGNGNYAAATVHRLEQMEPELATTAGATLVSASLDHAGIRYTLTTRSVSTGDTFSISLTGGAPPVRSCTGGGGCSDGRW
jgi:hypothetical protein